MPTLMSIPGVTLEDVREFAAAAVDYNPAVALMVAAGKGPLSMVGPTVRLGGPDEAAGYAEAFGDAWRATPGAVEWLVHTGVARVRRAPKGPKGRRGQGPDSRRSKTAGGRRRKGR